MLSTFRGLVGIRSSGLRFTPRQFHSCVRLQANNLFGELTENKQVAKEPETTSEDLDVNAITPENDSDLQAYYLRQVKEEQIRSENYVSPIKKRLFDLNVQRNGFFKNNQIVVDPENEKPYKLTLTNEEIDILEPSIYLQSYRIKSSVKKATIVNRFVRGWNVKSAINQLHFNSKKMSTELEKLLKRGLEQAKQLGVTPDELYVQSLWAGSDGDWRKRVDTKGRGRHGVIEHPYIHLKVILRTNQTKARLNWEKQQARSSAKPKMFLNNEPLNFKVRPYYKW